MFWRVVNTLKSSGEVGGMVGCIHIVHWAMHYAGPILRRRSDEEGVPSDNWHRIPVSAKMANSLRCVCCGERNF
jgi:hypothetical protein